MDIRVLNYFVTIAQKKNITYAAEKLLVTQPTLSQQIKDLEEELGYFLPSIKKALQGKHHSYGKTGK